LGEEGGRWSTGPRRNRRLEVAASAGVRREIRKTSEVFRERGKGRGVEVPGLFIGDRCLAGGGRVRVRGVDRRWGASVIRGVPIFSASDGDDDDGR
jgi:hypothetical protein